MKVFVLIGHQNKGSFNHAIAETVVSELEKMGHEVIFHDLYDEGFDPVLTPDEMARDSPLKPDVQRHCREITEAGGFVVVHPNWWGQPPAIVKGWMDRVFRQGVAYEFSPDGSVKGFFKGKTAVVFTTSNTPRDIEIQVYGDPLENLWRTCVFGFCGVQRFLRRNFESIVMSTQQQREGWLSQVCEVVRECFSVKPRDL